MPDHAPTQAEATVDRMDFLLVGIGASAGGLDACTKLVEALPADTGMAFILVQHVDPAHESMMVGLLARHTAMTVLQAADGMPIEPGHLYVIPPAAYLTVAKGVLRLTPSQRRGARLPFDVLLASLAEEYGARAACVVLSGTGTDGSLGAGAIKARSGLVIAQEPDEAGYDGMPRSVIGTGAVDLVLPVAEMPAALARHDRDGAPPRTTTRASPQAGSQDRLADILDLVRTQAVHDFAPYKPGTLQRRIERRMAMASIGAGDMDRYLALLRRDGGELARLASDLLINVTGFFRDPPVFKLLTERVAPELLRSHPAERQLRIWVAGCSTGEEAYSLAMVFHEGIVAAKADIKLQMFASDVDPDAVAAAREGCYPATIAADVPPERLARFFIADEHGYRVAPELRGMVVFTVQDVLADPPFSRLDLVSCRNLLIYLGADAQAKVVALFHFALREGGMLLLGSAETVGSAGDRFEVVSKPARLYRHVGRSRSGEFGFTLSAGDGTRTLSRIGRTGAPSRQATLGNLCSRFVMDSHAPATVVSNRAHDYLFSVGPTERYLRVAAGEPTHDLLAMVRGDTRTKLRTAMQQAVEANARVCMSGGQVIQDGHAVPFRIEVQPVSNDGEDLLLVCFVEDPGRGARQRRSTNPQDASRAAGLEHDLEAARTELQNAERNLELSSQEQKAINEEALSLNEEFQSTNEELLTSKEELQSLNEELNALNSQLQETLEQQRTTSNDLQNILYSTDVATLFLDTELKIRFFTPATKSLFSVIQGDVGRPLADLRSLAADGALAADARQVLLALSPIEREIEAPGEVWFRRRILPYRTHDGGVEGVVITFHDITRRKHAAKALEDAKQQAELANVAKSRFLAAASHDLRQPLQTLALLQGLLATTVRGEKAEKLVARLDDTLGAMSGMLNTLLDINQIEAGIVRAEPKTFAIDELLARLKDEFTYHAQARGLSLRVVPCHLRVFSDPRLLEQMVRNLLSNALKYTKHGKVLLGCRRRSPALSVEVWDTGVGIPDQELKAIFEEYHQVDNAARERSRGLGLGLSIVRRLGGLLDHRVGVRSCVGKGSVFTIAVMRAPGDAASEPGLAEGRSGHGTEAVARRTGVILVVEDDPEVRGLLALLLTEQGHRATAVADGPAALALLAQGTYRPDLILTDYNLPNGMDGLQVAAQVRDRLHGPVPAIILTGDISVDTLQAIVLQDCLQLNKPVKLTELTEAIQSLLPAPNPQAHPNAEPPAGAARTLEPSVVFVVDDDDNIRRTIRTVLENEGHVVEDYAAGEAFLEAYRPGRDGCLLIDAYLPGMGGLELLQRLRDAGDTLPAIMITGHSDVPMAVQAMKAGALDFIEKPIGAPELLASIERALEQSRDSGKLFAWREDATKHVSSLTPRQRQIMELVLAGHPSKNIAADLGVSQRTVENHRASIMKKTGAKSLPALARLALAASSPAEAGPTAQLEPGVRSLAASR